MSPTLFSLVTNTSAGPLTVLLVGGVPGLGKFTVEVVAPATYMSSAESTAIAGQPGVKAEPVIAEQLSAPLPPR